jgi:hypothetical protein
VSKVYQLIDCAAIAFMAFLKITFKIGKIELTHWRGTDLLTKGDVFQRSQTQGNEHMVSGKNKKCETCESRTVLALV